jgi:hypothetical protein
MISSRRAVPLLGLAFFFIFLYTVTSLSRQWRRTPEAVGLGELVASPSSTPSGLSNISLVENRPSRTPYAPQPQYVPGIPKPDGAAYTKMLVVPKTQEEDTNWIEAELPDWKSAIYVVDDPSAPLHPPKNKGHEVMVYLSFIIEHYDKLPDIVAFMHSHQFAWHNEEIFGGNAAEMLRRLNVARVVREGYMNLRCIWEPGCPDWMHPGTSEENELKQEETMLARSWGEIFPDDPVPQVLAQPCCAQFAVSRERILAVPKARFVFYRDWILRTELSDYISGRIWEYLWHVIFTGEHVVCPEVHVCFCDGYGLCFGGKDEYEAFRKLGHEKEELEEELKRWNSRAQTIEIARMRGTLGETSHLNIPEPGKDQSLQEQIYHKEQLINEVLYNATQRGMDPKARALEVGRRWTEGDGF